MALECAHCGARADDDARRCPKCLRSTLVAVDAPKPRAPRRRVVALIAAGVVVAGGVGAGVVALRSRPPAPPAVTAPAAAEPLAASEELRPLVERLRREGSPAARARVAADEVQRRRRARVAGEDDPPPPPRSPTLVWRMLPSPEATVAELDLARLVATLLRGAGDDAAVVERTGPTRAGEATAPASWLGAYMVRSGEQLVDVSAGNVVPASEFRHRAMSPTELGGAIAAQSAVEAASASGMGDRALEWANNAVEVWTTSPTPLAARARAWLAVGASSGLDLADQDLRAAIALRDDAPLHLERARVLLAKRDLAGAARESRRAATLAPTWGSAALATLALAPVIERLDAGAASGCAGLQSARAPWTDDAYALCADGVDAATREAAARRLLARSRDPLRLAWAARAIRPAPLAELRAKLTGPDRREAAQWLVLLGDPESAAALLSTPDGGA
ncbi:MAG: zinc ribbon domain-containing protein [Polyangiales bacterium]